MPNESGSYQPFGSGWQNLSNYLTGSNLRAVGKGENSGAVNMSRYSNPDSGSQFDEWLLGVNRSRDARAGDITIGQNIPTPVSASPYSLEPATPRQTPQQIAQQRRQQQYDDKQDTVYNPYRHR